MLRQTSTFTAKRRDFSITFLSTGRSSRFLLNPRRKYLTSHVGLIKRLAGSSWGTHATVLRTATLPCPILRLSTGRLLLVAIPILVLSKAYQRYFAQSDRVPASQTNRQHIILAGIQPTELCSEKTIL